MPKGGGSSSAEDSDADWNPVDGSWVTRQFGLVAIHVIHFIFRDSIFFSMLLTFCTVFLIWFLLF